MGHFVAQDDLHRIDLGDGEWVDIKREFDTDDWIRVEAVIRDVMDAEGQLQALFKNAKGLLTVAIKAWNLLGADGQPVPLSEESIGHLNRESLLAIAGVINEKNPLRSETERKKFSSVSTPRSRGAGATRKKSTAGP